MNRHWSNLCGAVCAAAVASAGAPAIAQGADEPIIVTGSRLPLAPAASADVIDAGSIEARDGASAVDLLRQVPGVAVSSPGGAGAISEIFLRGAESNFTVVLIDGVRVNDTSNARGGGFDFSTLNPDEIERVEIVRGPLSAVHGSDAMAGLISIETRLPGEEPVTRFRGEIGAEGYSRAFVSTSGALTNTINAGLSASAYDFGAPVEGASETLDTLQGNLVLEETPIGRIRAGVRRAHRERSGFAEASGGGLFAVNRDLARAEADEANAWANLRRAAFGDGWLDASLSYFARDEISASPAIPAGVFDASPATESDTQFRRVQANASASFDVTDKIGVSSGVDVQVEEGERTGAVDLGFAVLPSAYELDRVVGAVFAEGRYRVGDGLDLSAAARVDDPDDGEARASGRVSLAYEAPGGVLLRASWANGHKLPSFYALGDTLVGNPTLKVELSETTELSAQKAFGALSLHATAFSSRYRDLIDFDFTTFKLVNRARARVDGVELSARFQPSDALLLNVHATFTDIDVGGSEAGLLNRPEAYGGALVEWRPNADWTLQANLQVVGARGGSSIPTGFRTLSAYQRLDVSASRAIGAGARLFLAGDNVTDADIEEAAGFLSPGARFRVGVSLMR